MDMMAVKKTTVPCMRPDCQYVADMRLMNRLLSEGTTAATMKFVTFVGSRSPEYWLRFFHHVKCHYC